MLEPRQPVDQAEADVANKPQRIDDRFRERRHIAQPHVETLARDRMDDVRGIADQRQPLADEGARHRISQWVYATRADDFDLAELEPEPALELRVEEIVGKRDDR